MIPSPQPAFVYLWGNYFILTGIQVCFKFQLCLRKQKNKEYTDTQKLVQVWHPFGRALGMKYFIANASVLK